MVTASADPGAFTFQGKDPEEHFQFYFRQHWIRLLPSFLRAFVGSIGIIGLGYVMFFMVGIDASFARHILALMLTLSLVFVQLEFMVRFYRYFLYIAVVTDRKVHRIKKTLLAIDEHQSIDLWVLQDINKVQRGIIQNLFGFGTLILEASDTQMRIHFTPSITKRYEDLLFLRERAREQIQSGMQAAFNATVQRASNAASIK